MDPIYQFEFEVPETALDANHHVNNVAYLQWVNEAAIRHSEAAGCARMTRACGATWVVRAHRIEYLSPAFAGDKLRVQTWVADLRKVRSLRRYRFIRLANGALLAQGETHWVFVDALTGRPRAIPPEIRQAFQVAPEIK
jgi:acyl-CoA thioester hydrolase